MPFASVSPKNGIHVTLEQEIMGTFDVVLICDACHSVNSDELVVFRS